MMLDNYSYISLVEKSFNENGKYPKLDVPACKKINHINSLEKKTTTELKLLKFKDTIGKSVNKSIKPVASIQHILNRIGKIHQQTFNIHYTSVVVIQLLAHLLTNYYKLLQFLTSSTANEYTAIDSFQFA